MSDIATSESFAPTQAGGGVLRLAAQGAWTASNAERIDDEIAHLEPNGAREAEIDLSGVSRLDTAGAWLLERTRRLWSESGIATRFVNVNPERAVLLDEIQARVPKEQRVPVTPPGGPGRLLEEVGEGVILAGRDIGTMTSFLGAIVAGLGQVVFSPSRLRLTSVVNQLEQTGLRAVPIIALISFLVGGIVAQQGAFQLRQFGADLFVVDLVGILVLRELGLLLTAIMVAGRSGSAFTAEIGSMKMREEIDALRVFGLDPIEVLVLPRIIALIIALPLLTFVANISALVGAAAVSWIYVGIMPEVFLGRLREALDFSTFAVGMIKAPFMAVIIGMIASIEGMRVEGSAESLGRHTTASVVKAIFMVIVVDGIFAMFFAAIDY